MDFKFNEEEELFRKSSHEFFQKNVAPIWTEIDEKRWVPLELVKKMAKQGLLATTISEEYGGPGGSAVMATIAVEESAYAEPSVSIAPLLLVNNAWTYMLQTYGTEEAKQELLPHITAGDALYCAASTESQGGSDVGGFRTLTAKRKDDRTWVLNGEKVLVTFMDHMDQSPWGGGYFLIARSGPLEKRHKALTAFNFLVKKEGKRTPGYEFANFEEIGRHGVHTGSITLSDVEIEDKYRIGDENKGFYVAMEGFNFARCMVGIATIGAARWALEQGREWIKERKLFGKPISSFQGVSFKFAELYAQLEAARLMCYRAASFADRYYVKKDPTISVMDVAVASACAKMMAPEIAVAVFEEVMKWHGGMAYFKEIPLYRGWLGAFSYTIGAEGPQNTMRYIIARNLIGPEYCPI